MAKNSLLFRNMISLSGVAVCVILAGMALLSALFIAFLELASHMNMRPDNPFHMRVRSVGWLAVTSCLGFCFFISCCSIRRKIPLLLSFALLAGLLVAYTLHLFSQPGARGLIH